MDCDDSEITVMTPTEFIAYLKLSDPRHYGKATYWAFNLRTGSLNTREEDPASGLAGECEAAFNATGYWIPRLHILAGLPFVREKSVVFPDKPMFDRVRRILEICGRHELFIVTWPGYQPT